MSKSLLAAALLLASASASFAYAPPSIDINSLSGKAMAEHPGVTSRKSATRLPGTPSEFSLSGHEMRNHPGNRGGSDRPMYRPFDERGPFELPADG